MMGLRRGWTGLLLVVAMSWGVVPAAFAQEPQFFEEEESASESGVKLTWGMEAKAHFRESDYQSFVSPFPFVAAGLLSEGQQGLLETVNPGSHFEVSVLSLLFTAEWADTLTAHAKVDVIDLYDRNPTSGDREIDVDEVWLRLGRETPTAVIPDRSGYYLKVGKFAPFERQDDRHLESYGLLSTAFNRFEDAGLEVGFDLGRYFYVKGSLTQGNPLFMRDVNALAGDNGLGTLNASLDMRREVGLGTGIPILYDAEVEDLDADGDLEVGYGLGARFGSADGRRTGEVLLWHHARDLAESVKLNGTFYRGDLDLLRGPLNELGFEFGLDVRGNKKEETGANLWLYWNALTVFAQVVEQEVAGFDRDGFEVELSYRFEFPLRWSLAGRQLFPSLAPAVRYSELDIGPLGGNPLFPAVSLRWDWEKLDYGLRLTIIEGIDLTVEYADVDTILANGAVLPLDEFLATFRWRL